MNFPISKELIGLFCSSLALPLHLIICIQWFMSTCSIELVQAMIWLLKLQSHFQLWASVIKTGLIFQILFYLMYKHSCFLKCQCKKLCSTTLTWLPISIFRLHCINLLEEQQKVDSSVTNLTKESTRFNDRNKTLDLLNQLLHKSGCFNQICDQIAGALTLDIKSWKNEIQDLTNDTYEAIMTRSKLG